MPQLPPQTIGQWRLRSIFPPDIEVPAELDKKALEGLWLQMAERHPDQYVDTLHNFVEQTRVAATRGGSVTSISLSDLRLPAKAAAMRMELRKQVDGIEQDPQLTSAQKKAKILELMRSRVADLPKQVTADLADAGSHVGIAAQKGFRGSPLQATQMTFGSLMVNDHRGRPVPIVSLRGFAEGVTPLEYLASSFGSRTGYWKVQHATAQSGYTAKLLAMMSQNLRVTSKDCGAQGAGVPADGGDPENIGTVLALPAGNYPAGTPVTRAMLPELAGTTVRLRSPLACRAKDGLCQVCAGKRDKGDFPQIGAYLGLDSSAFTTNPMTQTLGLSTKHTGGVISDKHKAISGLPEIQQFWNVPERFQDAAVLADQDGKVDAIRPAAQGGSYITVNGVEHYAPAFRTLAVKPGDAVEAGDALTDGTPNPKDVVRHKGIGAGRLYITERFGQILKDNGIGAPRRHVEMLARAFTDRVKVTDPDNVAGYAVGDVVPYSHLEQNYVPRLSARERSPSLAVGQYLEKPALHYTIGTRLTPRVAKDLAAAGVRSVLADPAPPGFEPAVTRAMDVIATDPDWETRLSGFNIHKAFMQAAQTGADSSTSGTSYVPRMIKPDSL